MLGSVALTIAALELGVRAYRSDFSFGNRLAALNNLLRSAYPAAHDPKLGWVPKAGSVGTANIWGTEVRILENTTRANGLTTNPAVPERPVTVAVGDSFTFGDEVSDHDTWPAVLERLTGMRTINGGVFGYGVDQSALRARALINDFAPRLIIFSLIHDDIQRTQLAERTSVKKPYFILREDNLILRGVPVPPIDTYRQGQAATEVLKELASRSLLIHEVMRRAAPEWWAHGRWSEKKVHGDGNAVSCRLITTLADDTKAAGIDFLVLVQYSKFEILNQSSLEGIDRLIACLAPHGIAVLDLRQYLRAVAACDQARFDAFYKQRGHMSGAGNAFTAKMLQRAIALKEGDGWKKSLGPPESSICDHRAQ
jgi:hypothetical protein